jgi:hypothetical protein
MLDGLLERCQTTDETLSVLDSRLSALHIATDWAGLVDAIPQRDRLREQTGCRVEKHTDDEIVLVEARWRTSDDFEPILADALACVEDTTASPRHRLGAATHALILNDTFCSKPVADRVMAIAQPLFPLVANDDPRDALAVSMIYITTHGDLTRALRDSKNLVELDRRTGNPARLARTLRFASNPARILGRWADAEASLREALRISETYGLTSALNALACLADCAADVDNLEAASAWIERAIQSAVWDPERTHVSVMITAARIELMQGRAHKARELVAPFLDRMLTDKRTRVRNCGLAVALRIRRLSGAGANPDLVEQLYEGHLIARSWALHDEEAETLVHCLNDLGRIDEARETLCAYVTRFRRERWPIPRSLRQVCAELGMPWVHRVPSTLSSGDAGCQLPTATSPGSSN